VPLLPTPNERDSFRKLACAGRSVNAKPRARHTCIAAARRRRIALITETTAIPSSTIATTTPLRQISMG
jgi:hypothetical protein